VLVLRPGALGDTVLTEPVLASLREALPEAAIKLAGRPEFARLLVGPADADACLSADDPAFTSLYTTGPLDLPPLDLVVAYLPDPDGSLAARLATRADRVSVLDPRPPEGATTHIADRLLAVLEPLGLTAARNVPRLACRPEWAAEAREAWDRPARYVVVHPGSGGRRKLWPAARWRAVLARLPVPAVVTSGPADAAVAAELGKAAPDAVVLRDLSTTALAGLLAGAVCFVGCDSGVTHLAAALGTPTVAVFGPTDPAVWGPRGERAEIVCGWDGTTESVAPDAVIRAACRWLRADGDLDATARMR
jgi:ADP-heptose:LPS heptosyltransferase